MANIFKPLITKTDPQEDILSKTKITQQIVEKAYEIAIKVYKKQLDKKSGMSLFSEQYGMNISSAGMYIDIINLMIDGQVYNGTLDDSTVP